MSVLDYFRSKKKPPTASLAKERLQIVVAHQRDQRKQSEPDYLPQLQRELVDVISKYVHIDRDQVSVNLENSDDCSILELNVTLPEAITA